MSKSSIRELSIFGGPPAFEEPLHVGRPNLGDRAALLARIDGALDRRWLTNNGVLVQEFERRIEQLLGVKHCVAMCNATTRPPTGSCARSTAVAASSRSIDSIR